MNDLAPDLVHQRLAALRSLYEPELAADARARLEYSSPRDFDRAVAERLEELRALLELTAYLHHRR
jgi:hypothetical protein